MSINWFNEIDKAPNRNILKEERLNIDDPALNSKLAEVIGKNEIFNSISNRMESSMDANKLHCIINYLSHQHPSLSTDQQFILHEMLALLMPHSNKPIGQVAHHLAYLQNTTNAIWQLLLGTGWKSKIASQCASDPGSSEMDDLSSFGMLLWLYNKGMLESTNDKKLAPPDTGDINLVSILKYLLFSIIVLLVLAWLKTKGVFG